MAKMDTDQSVNIAPEPSSRTRRPEDRGPEIARAALDLFVSRGFSATKLEDVARAAGVSLTHIPYKGNGPALVDVASEHDHRVGRFCDGLPAARGAKSSRR